MLVALNWQELSRPFIAHKGPSAYHDKTAPYHNTTTRHQMLLLSSHTQKDSVHPHYHMVKCNSVLHSTCFLCFIVQWYQARHTMPTVASLGVPFGDVWLAWSCWPWNPNLDSFQQTVCNAGPTFRWHFLFRLQVVDRWQIFDHCTLKGSHVPLCYFKWSTWSSLFCG